MGPQPGPPGGVRDPRPALPCARVACRGSHCPLRLAALSIGLAASLALLDELRQAQLATRVGSAFDVALDVGGACAAVAVGLLWAAAPARAGGRARPAWLSGSRARRAPAARRPGWLDRVERAGNALPDPATLFALGALAVAAAAELAVLGDWTVQHEGETLRARSLLSADGIYWALQSLVGNFTGFAPLGVVLVGMLGIGVAERSGLIGAALRALLTAVPGSWLTPTVFFLGVMSSLGLDAGYVVLPPVAAALFAAVGRPPLVGLGAVFAGVSAGFSANLVVTSLDPMLAEFSMAGAQLLDPDYEVSARANLWFMRASTVLLTGVGWAVTSWWVEPRFTRERGREATPEPAGSEEVEVISGELTARERRALAWACAAAALCLLGFAVATWLPGAPLHGRDGDFPRWVRVIVPLLFVVFLVPGVVYGALTGSVSSDRDVARMLGESMSGMGSYIVLAFFAAQFIAWFGHSNLGPMLAISGGQALAAAALPTAALMLGFVAVVGLGNLLIGSMSAKYAFFAPVFVPMFMAAGISPELTQAAYRVGDSVTNVITPLNPYVVIVLTFMRRYDPQAGIGTLVALMLPYCLAFAVAWSAVLALWVTLGVPLGPDGSLVYTP